MEPKKDVVEKGRSVRDMHHLRLMSLLQELERDNGRKKAAEVLGVDRRTLDASLDEGVLTRRIRGALEKALQSGVGSAAAEQRDRNDRLADRLEDLEGGFEELGKEMRENNRASEDRDMAIREEMAQGLRQREREQAERRTAGDAGGEAKANNAGPQPRNEVFAQAGVPRPRDVGARRGRRGRVRGCLAPDRRVAGAEGRSSRRGKEPVLAAHRGAVPGVGDDAVGRAGADASPGDVSAAGVRPQRAGQLAEDSALRHAEGAEKAGASAHADAQTLVEIARRVAAPSSS